MLFDSFFQAGNVLTLAIVLIILAVYRQLDKDNRSLEKVKKFADRMKDEIGAYVDDKSRDMQNLAIELDVHQKTAKEILSRLNSAESALAERSGAFEEVSAHIAGYDAALKELGEMTGKVEENLKRIASESEFVDTVARRVKAVAGQLSELEKNAPQIETRLQDESRKILENLKEEIIRGVFDELGRLKKEMRETGSRVDEFAESVRSLKEEQSDLERDTIESLKNSAEELRQDLDRTKGSLEEEFEAKLSSLGDSAEKDILDRINRAAESGRNLESEVLESLRDYIENRVGEVKAETAAWKVSAERSMEEQQAGLGRSLDNLEQLFNGVKTESEGWKSEAETALEGHRLGMQKKLADLETRLLEYEEDTGYRFSRIEEITRDMDQLEENLKGSMDRVSARIRKEFADFSAVLTTEREAERQQAEEELKSIHAAMGQLEEEINALKAKAYDSISENLKLMEDDFFSDLRTRSAAMQEQFQDWREKVRENLDTLAQESENRRSDVEEQYRVDLDQRLNTVREEITGQLESMSGEVNQFYQRMQQQIAGTETDMKSLEDAIRQDVEEARRQSRASFETIFTEHDTSIKDQVKRNEREFQAELKRIGDELGTGRKELTSLLEAAKSDVTVWQAQVLQQLKEAEAELAEDLSGFKLSTKENTAELVKTYSEEQEELVQNSQAERARIRNEIKSLSESVLELQNELRKRSEESLDRHSRDSEEALTEFQRRSRELLSESDETLKEFRVSAADIKDKVETVQTKLFGKIDDQYKILTVKLQEIDKRQKNFVEQTKIFDRADSLKTSLEETLEDLKSEIARVDAMSKEIKESERKFVKVQKLGEEVGAKFTRFLSERGRIEEMEGDFKKLINLSQAIDLKLNDVTTSHDTLTSLQAQLRQLEDVQKEVDLKFERLESKGNVLDATAAGVDKNFQSLEELEGRVKEITGQISGLPRGIESIRQEIAQLSANKDRADEAMEKLEALDGVLRDIEERSGKMQQAREWLARTETRLQEVGKQAQEQVKLLGSIMKEETRRGTKEKGAPNLGAREVVTKLAHQGWSVEEIARATKLSRGEVELILELLPKKG